MAKNKGTAVVIIVVAVILAVVVGLVLFYTNSDSVKERTMVEIRKDGKKVAEITDLEYQYNLLSIITQLEQSYGLTDPTEAAYFWMSVNEGMTQLDWVKNFTLEQAEYEKIEYLKAIEFGTKLTNDEKADLEVSFENVEAQLNELGWDIDDYLLENYGISFKMYKRMSEDNKILNKFRTEQIYSIEVTEDEVKAFYDEYVDNYYTVTVRHILLLTVDADNNPLSEEEIQQKQELAEELLERVNNGEDMDTLVEEYSEDPGMTTNYGYYDVTQNSGYIEEFTDWVMSSQVGDTGIVMTSYGYHVTKTFSISEYEEMKLQVEEDLQVYMHQQSIQEWYEEYDIVVYDSIYDEINPFS